MVGAVFVVLALAAGVFALGYLFGRDTTDAEVAVHIEVLERAQRIQAVTLDSVNQMFLASETPE